MAHRSNISHSSLKRNGKPSQGTRSDKTSSKHDVEQRDPENWNHGSHGYSAAPARHRSSGHSRHPSGDSKDGRFAGMGSWDNQGPHIPLRGGASGPRDILSFVHQTRPARDSHSSSRHAIPRHDRALPASVSYSGTRRRSDSSNSGQSGDQHYDHVHRYLFGNDDSDKELPSNARVTRDSILRRDNYPGYYKTNQSHTDGKYDFEENSDCNSNRYARRR